MWPLSSSAGSLALLVIETGVVWVKKQVAKLLADKCQNWNLPFENVIHLMGERVA